MKKMIKFEGLRAPWKKSADAHAYLQTIFQMLKAAVSNLYCLRTPIRKINKCVYTRKCTHNIFHEQKILIISHVPKHVYDDILNHLSTINGFGIQSFVSSK